MWTKKTVVALAALAVALSILRCYAVDKTHDGPKDTFLGQGDKVLLSCNNGFTPYTSYDATGAGQAGTELAATGGSWTCTKKWYDDNYANAAVVAANIVQDPATGENSILAGAEFQCRTADAPASSRILCNKSTSSGTTGGTTAGTTGSTSSAAASTFSVAVVATSLLSLFALA